MNYNENTNEDNKSILTLLLGYNLQPPPPFPIVGPLSPKTGGKKRNKKSKKNKRKGKSSKRRK